MTEAVGAERLNEVSRADFGPLPLARALGAATACGVLYFLAFPGLDIWPLGFVALVPLRLALAGQTPKRAFWLGWVAGLVMNCLGFYWMVEMLRMFSGFPTVICAFFALVVNAFQGLRMGAFAWLFVRAERRGWSSGLVWLAALAATEVACPVLFWWSFGAVVHPVPALTQAADLFGIIGVGVIVAAFNFALAEGAIALLRRERPRWRSIAGFGLAPLFALLYGAIRIPAVDARSAAAQHAEIGVVQANMSLMDKRHDPMESLRRHLQATATLVQRSKPDLVLWSETIATPRVLTNSSGELGQPGLRFRVGVPLLYGAVLLKPVTDARRYALFNAALLADANGVVLGRYDKRDLVAFSEKMPFGKELPWLYEISPNSGKFEPSEHPDPIPFGEHRIGVTICNDDVSTSATSRVTRDPDVDLITNLTNDAWFGDTTEPWIHLALAKFRAIEHRRFFVRATNSGVSAVVDPVGRVVAKTATFREETLSQRIAWLRGGTVYDALGDYPCWAAAAFVVFAAFRRRPERSAA